MKYWFNLITKSQGKRLYIGIFWAFVTALSGVALLMLSGWFITATALTGLAISAGLVVVFDMYMPGSGIRFFALSRTVGRYVERIYNHDSILRLISTYRLTLFKGLTNLSSKQLRATSDSEWLGKLTSDLDALDTILLSYIIPPIVAALSIITLSLFLSFFWFDLALYLGGALLLCLFASIRITIKRTKQFGSLSASLLNACRSDVIEHLQGAYELQSHDLMQDHEQQILTTLDDFYRAQNTLNTSVANIQLLLDLVLGLIIMALICATLMAVNSGLISGGIAIMIVMMFLGLSELLQMVPSQFNRWGNTSFSANRLTSLAESVASKPVITKTIIDDINNIDIEIYANKRIAVSQHSPLVFSLAKNTLVNLQGRSGSGKSTVAQLLIGSEQANDTGSDDPSNLSINNLATNNITINKQLKIEDISRPHWYGNLVYLEQKNVVLAGTLGYNLSIGLADVTEDDIWKALKLVELFDWANALPQGLNTWLGEAGSKISGGQARRISLARLLLRNPQLIILDEPFNGVDEKMAERIWQNIQPWLRAKMSVLLTHERPGYLIKESHLSTQEYTQIDTGSETDFSITEVCLNE